MSKEIYATVNESRNGQVYYNNSVYRPENFTEEDRQILESGGTVTYKDDDGEVCEIWLDFGDEEEEED